MKRRLRRRLCRVVMLTGVGARRCPPRRERRLHVGRGRAPRHADARGTARRCSSRAWSRVTWLDHGKPNDITVDVTDDNGAIEVESGQARGVRPRHPHVLQEPARLVERARSSPSRRTCPRRITDGRSACGAVPRSSAVPPGSSRRPASDGTAAQKLYLDADTNLLLRREVLDARGQRAAVARVPRPHRRQRRSRAATLPPACARAKAVPLDSVPSGYVAPSTPSGYVLVGPSRHPNGVELLYSDGLFTVSVLEQRGELDWDGLPNGGIARRGGRQPCAGATRSPAPTCSCGSATAPCSRACPTRHPT